MVLSKSEIEASLLEENKLIQDGKLKQDFSLDLSLRFSKLCEACRHGDLKLCQETITEGANINARDIFDYTPLILTPFISEDEHSETESRGLLAQSNLRHFTPGSCPWKRHCKASLCGHFEVVQLLLESGALCERDTFQGERCLYNALNDRIRNLLLSYDYSKSTDPLQPFAAHITSLLARTHPQTSDILVTGAGTTFLLHKFVLSTRSPYFSKKLSNAPDTTTWKLPAAIPPQAFDIAIRYIYLGETPNDVGGGPGTGFSEEEVVEGLDKISRHLEIRRLWDDVLEAGDLRVARQRRIDEIERGRDQLEAWFEEKVIKHKVIIDTSRANDVKWDRNNGIFADVLLRADESTDDIETCKPAIEPRIQPQRNGPSHGIPVGPMAQASRSPSRTRKSTKSVLFPVHRAMLTRSEFFLTMFSSGFREAQDTEHLQIIPIDCSPEVLEIVIRFLYTEKVGFSLGVAIDVLFAADLLLIEKLKHKAAVVISTLGNGSMSRIPPRLAAAENGFPEEDDLDIYDVVRAGWLTRVPRLEEFGARYFAYRLEDYIDKDEFSDLVKESAARIKGRQETDTIELLDDIRYYLSERFRLRFEDAGLEDMMEEDAERAVQQYPAIDSKIYEEEAIDVSQVPRGHLTEAKMNQDVTIRTLDGEVAGDELEEEARNYQILLGKIDGLLDKLKLDA